MDNWTDEDLQQVLPGFCYLLHIAKEALPNTRIVVILNTDSNTQITDGYKEACNKNNIKFLELENISKQSGHPNIAGIKQISSQLTSIF